MSLSKFIESFVCLATLISCIISDIVSICQFAALRYAHNFLAETNVLLWSKITIY